MRNYMTHGEALEALHNGFQVSHYSFSKDEYLQMVDGIILDESGYNFEKGFNDRRDWVDSWFIYEKSEQCNCPCHKSSGKVMHIAPCC